MVTPRKRGGLCWTFRGIRKPSVFHPGFMFSKINSDQKSAQDMGDEENRSGA